MTATRRMRRFRDKHGTQYDELVSGQLRRRLLPGDPAPHPAPEDRAVIEARVGTLTEMTTAEINMRFPSTTTSARWAYTPDQLRRRADG